jgi:hypothetical protein
VLAELPFAGSPFPVFADFLRMRRLPLELLPLFVCPVLKQMVMFRLLHDVSHTCALILEFSFEN